MPASPPPPAAAMAPFSPLPWRKHAPSRIIEDANGAFVASITLSPDGVDDLIVTAVNSHRHLVDALTLCALALDVAEVLAAGLDQPVSAAIFKAKADEARAALARATAGGAG